jgi:outer membrane immunogenic protein
VKKILIAGILFACIASPAAAQTAASFEGVRVQGLVGADLGNDRSHDVVVGAAIGYDIAAGGAVVGVEVGVLNEFFVAGRVGARLGSNALLFGRAGYTRGDIAIYDQNDVRIDTDHLSGVQAGGGIEVGLGSRLFVTGEYRYSNFEGGFDAQQLVGGVGLRF